MISEDVIILINCDVDPDRPLSGWTGIDWHSVTWKGVRKGIPLIKKIAGQFSARSGKQVKMTWFLRSDKQMQELCGECAWPASQFESLWNDLKSQGDEIGWHPHFWRWNEKARVWHQERIDQNWLIQCLKEGHKSLLGHFPVTSVRTGWCFHNNVSMKTVSDLGLICDLSAIPGIFCLEKPRLGYDVSDWRQTPSTPYYPSALDYRKRGSGEDALPILEIPTFCHRVPLLSSSRALLGQQNTYQANILKHPYFFKAALNKLVEQKRGNRQTFLSITMHADEALSDDWLFSWKNLPNNLEHIADVMKRHKVSYTFATATEAAALIKSNSALAAPREAL